MLLKRPGVTQNLSLVKVTVLFCDNERLVEGTNPDSSVALSTKGLVSVVGVVWFTKLLKGYVPEACQA